VLFYEITFATRGCGFLEFFVPNFVPTKKASRAKIFVERIKKLGI
jgi:hypothetical protein